MIKIDIAYRDHESIQIHPEVSLGCLVLGCVILKAMSEGQIEMLASTPSPRIKHKVFADCGLRQ